MLAAGELCLCVIEPAQTPLPFALQPPGHQAVFGFHRAVTALGPLGLVAGPLDGQAPLRECRVVVGLQLLGGHHHRLEAGRVERCEKGLAHRCIDLDPTDVQAIDAAAVDCSCLPAQWYPGVEFLPR